MVEQHGRKVKAKDFGAFVSIITFHCDISGLYTETMSSGGEQALALPVIR